MHIIEQAELETLIRLNVPARIIDVRKKPAVEKEPSMIAGAAWQDFSDVAGWIDQVRSDDLVVCYCVHGHEVSQSAVAALRDQGVNAWYLRGGLEAWHHRSGPLNL